MTPEQGDATGQVVPADTQESNSKVVLRAEELAFGGSHPVSSRLIDARQLISELTDIVVDIEAKVESLGEESVFGRMEDMLSQIQSIRTFLSCSEEMNLKNFFQEKLLPYTIESEFCNYSYRKPRGYAGDFGAMELIWKGRTEPQKYRYCGTSTRGRLINAFTLDSANCRANEYRVHFLNSVLARYTGASVASVGCGSAIELNLMSASFGNQTSVTLFDQDKDALHLAESRLTGGFAEIKAIPGNILKNIFSIEMKAYDCIYSSGLFDYFEMKSAQKLIEKLWGALKSGGTLCVTNAHPDNPTRLWMEYVGEWNLVYKNLYEMVSLIEDTPALSEVKVVKDPFSVYQYLLIEKRQ